ncbi:demethylmenaquinone methyltransferase-like [Asterias rubens]|uniref:demethylmenaquinone methyltransferase-like n=1 Tax=Asterias rubens TaxID=7604 RepID=UPI0014552CA7|nr:demethylmenaquinone methyltransferase-like [Asterias rubens]XP_033628999.1 demethylmenaquinone methyltransferase-like [Asterias rubens]XP_033629000.1 demethylmenaquinone methyltransferase-like [Asterias rubens]
MGLSNSVGRNLRKPSGSLTGAVVKRLIKNKNAYLEHNAVRRCHLESHHHILEVGFGPGIGLKAACEIIKDGKVYGIDYSKEMLADVTKSLQSEIASGRLQVVFGDAASLPYSDTLMDRIFHCNCFYFWPEPATVAGELYRVLKPGGFMVTTMNVASVAAAAEKGFLKGTNWNPEQYMDVLRSAGFQDVTMEDLVHEDSGNGGTTYQAIMAHKN